MIKMCDLPRYADADMEEIKKIPSRDQIPAEDKVIACVICGMQRSRIQSGTLRKMPLPCRQDRLPELRSTAVPENAWYAAFHR